MNKLLLISILSLSSLPVFAYWQQEVNYKINVALNDVKHELSANIEIEYINNSPDTLKEIYIHLWPNAYQTGSLLDDQIKEDNNHTLHFGEEEYQGCIDSLNFTINNQAATVAAVDSFTNILKILLPNPLLPNGKTTIKTPFKVKVPKGEVSRLGHLDGGYQITQWYPKPAVYDKTGWHPLSYLSIGEFYSEYGNFNVEITIPNKHTLAASGNLKKQSQNATTKTFEYELKNAHDFAWFTDTNWIEEFSEVNLPNSGRVVKTSVKYKRNNQHIWQNSVQFVDSAIYYYSLWIGDYPYDVCTAVDGGLTAGAGMEYPTVTVLSGENRVLLEEVIVHEVGHNWFYGILGTNERDFPWMDEGINSYYERRYFEEVKNDLNIGDMIPLLKRFLKETPPSITRYHELAYEFSRSRGKNIPANLPAHKYSSLNYGSVVYSKVALCFNYLEKYLTQPVFDEIMQTYFQNWSFKHPYPADLQTLFETKTDKNLDWFFNDLLASNADLDYQIINAGATWANDAYEIVVNNNGDIKGPLSITALKNKKPQKTVWYEGFDGKRILSFPLGDYDEIIIDYYNDTPEKNRQNNRYEVYNFLGRIEPLEITFLYNFPKVDKSQAYFLPIAGYNVHDNLQLGIAAYNSVLFEKPFRFLLMPQFSFGTQRLVGFGELTYSVYPKSYFQKINFNLAGKRQGLALGVADGQIQKAEAGVNFIFDKIRDRSKIKQNLEVRFTSVEIGFDRRAKSLRNYLTLDYNYENKRKINGNSFNARLQNFGQNTKIQGEYKYHLTVNKKEQTIDLRLFAGAFLTKAVDLYTERFTLNANNGTLFSSSDQEIFNQNSHDYLFDEAMLGRFVGNAANFARQQIFMRDAGFKSGLNPFVSDNWISAINITIPTPSKYLSFYADFATGDILMQNYQDDAINSPIIYDYGLQLNIVKNYFEIYFPFGHSQQITDSYDLAKIGDDPTTPDVNERVYAQRIKFLFNINELYQLTQ